MLGQRGVYRLLWGLGFLALFSFGCGLVSTVGRLKSTANAAETKVQTGREALGTGEAVVTKEGSLLVGTLAAAATQVQQSGLPQTAAAAITQVSKSGLPQTAQAVVTQMSGGGLQKTAQSVVTEVYSSPDKAPLDIPIMDGQKSAFIGSPQAISYFIKADFSAVLKFYQEQMPARGWTKIDYGTTITDTTAELYYQKGAQKAHLVITAVPFVNQTTIVINLE